MSVSIPGLPGARGYITLRGDEVLRKKAVPQGNGAHVYVPKEWLGDEVAVVRTTPLADDGGGRD